MNRRAFLRRTVCVGVAAVAMPYVSRSHFRDIVAWLRKAWPRERLVVFDSRSPVTSATEINRLWRKIQGELQPGFQFLSEEYTLLELGSLDVPAARLGPDFSVSWAS